jgi:hypothetical protein
VENLVEFSVGQTASDHARSPCVAPLPGNEQVVVVNGGAGQPVFERWQGKWPHPGQLRLIFALVLVIDRRGRGRGTIGMTSLAHAGTAPHELHSGGGGGRIDIHAPV